MNQKHIVIASLSLVISNSQLQSQVVSIEDDPRVVSSTGLDSDDGVFQFGYTVGEVAVQTQSSADGRIVITEGFRQPGDGLEVTPVTFSTTSEQVQCPDVINGSITVRPQGCVGPYTIQVVSDNGADLAADQVDVEYTFNELDTGVYVITVRGETLCAERDTVVVTMKNSTCDLVKYNGITPNGDGKNDFWEIDNIEINQPNEVKIFNRWGAEIWSAQNYNNTDVIWSGENSNGQPLPSGTYFYTISVAGDSDASSSGWIQVTR